MSRAMETCMTKPRIAAFFDEPTNTVSYLVSDPATGRAAVIDPFTVSAWTVPAVETRTLAEALRAYDRDGTVRLHVSGARMRLERDG